MLIPNKLLMVNRKNNQLINRKKFSNLYNMNSLQEYLKKYSVINNEFINDFFSLYDRNTTENDFVVNIETIAKWLKTTKGHLKETLINSYSLNIDYKTKKEK